MGLLDTNLLSFLLFFPLVWAVIGIAYAFNLYKDFKKAEALRKRFAGLNKILENKWYIDEIYEALVVRPIHALSEGLWRGFDVGVIDRIVVGFGKVTERAGQTVRVIQTGSIQVYALMLLIGMVATVGYLVYGLAR